MQGKNLQIIGLLIIIIAVTFPFFISQQTLAITNVNALSGSAKDIQVAVDQVVASSGIGDVHIPAGTFNFVEVGEPWMTVNIPAGVNIYGAPTERTSGLPVPDTGMNPNDQVIEWKTVLVMPYDVPSGNTWFRFTGTGDTSITTRFSDIKLVGYRDIDPASITTHIGVHFIHVKNFRVDHSEFNHTTSGGVSTVGPQYEYSSGVIDHNRLVNEYGTGYGPGGVMSNIGYGVSASVLGRGGTGNYPPTFDIVIDEFRGKYHPEYSIYAEDNYLSRWRHITVNMGQHMVFRYNTIEYDQGFGSLDAHPSSRLFEIYNNTLINQIDYGHAIWIRGGRAVIFNNYVRTYTGQFVGLYDEFRDWGWGEDPARWRTQDVWIWDNDVDYPIIYAEDTLTEGVDYFLELKPGYAPYTYPHPLVSGEPPAIDGMGTLNVEASYNNQSITANVEVSTFNGQTPYSQELPVGTYTVVVTSEYGSNTSNVEILSGQVTSINVGWSNTSITPTVIIDTPEQPRYLLLMQIPLVFIGAFMIWKGRKK